MPSSISSTALSKLNHRHLDTSASTNSELIEAIQAGRLSVNERHLLTAETQTAGRGQGARSWQSPRGNVYLSLYQPIAIPISGLLSLIIGVQLADMPIIQSLNKHLRAQNSPPIGVKWANDLGFYNTQIMANDYAQKDCAQKDYAQKNDAQKGDTIAFNKLAGILIEPIWQAGKLIGVVIGVGMNVKTAPKLTLQTLEGMSYRAISLQDMHKKIEAQNESSLPSLALLYEQISTALIKAIARFERIVIEKTNQTTTYVDEFIRQFNQVDALAGLIIKVTQTPYNQSSNQYNYQTNTQTHDRDHIITGQACGIDTNGCLQLQQDNGKICALFTGRIEVLNKA